jgi:hypothetical protein
MELLGILDKYGDVDLAHQRYGSSDARTFEIGSYSEADTWALWAKVGGGIFKTGKPWNCIYHVSFIKTVWAKAMSSFWIHLSGEFFRSEGRSERFVNLCKEIYSWGRMDHGFVALEGEYLAKNEFGAGRGVGGPNLTKGLPGIYWANFFGPVYVTWMGENRFDKLGDYARERLLDGGWLVFARDNLFDFDPRTTGPKEDQLIKHLGRDAFFEMQRPHKSIRTPDFWRH